MAARVRGGASRKKKTPKKAARKKTTSRARRPAPEPEPEEEELEEEPEVEEEEELDPDEEEEEEEELDPDEDEEEEDPEDDDPEDPEEEEDPEDDDPEEEEEAEEEEPEEEEEEEPEPPRRRRASRSRSSRANGKAAPPRAAAGGVPSWMRRGDDAQEHVKREQEAAERRREQLWRFRLKENEEATITFLTGDLAKKGKNAGKVLDLITFNEHTVPHRGRYENFVCIADEGPCPLCRAGNNASLVAVFVVIDHRRGVSKAGKKWRDQKRLFMAKSATISKLTRKAAKLGGLKGMTFEVSRGGGRTPAVGDEFEYLEGPTTLKALARKYPDTKVLEPLDFAVQFPRYSAEELVEMGLGSSQRYAGDGPEREERSSDANDDVPF